tara:strand:- start:122 stop:382 length:261 start_codon:yes stop_codon:yes gene_type:complete
MRIELKSFAIGVLVTVNLILLYGFSPVDDCSCPDTLYNNDDIMGKLNEIGNETSSLDYIDTKLGNIHGDLRTIETDVAIIRIWVEE